MKKNPICFLAALLALSVPAFAAPEDVTPEVWSQIAPQVERASYEFQPQADAVIARNHAQDFCLAADPAGLAVNGALRLRAVALDGELLPDAEPVADGRRLEYRRGAVMEWFENRAEGLEQGFTIEKFQVSGFKFQVSLDVAFETELAVRVSLDGQAVELMDGQGEIRYRYAGLKVTDANHQPVASFFQSQNANRKSKIVRIVCDASRAQFPLTIDPVLTSIAHELPRYFSSPGDHFGYSVAVDGDVALVGSIWMDAVVVYERDPHGTNTWIEGPALPASGVDHADQFGYSVAVDGDVAVVGAPYDDDRGLDAGAAYVFERNAGGTNHWGQVKKFALADTGISNYFGHSVAVAGDVIAVGANAKDNWAGRAYIFERNSGGTNYWGLVNVLQPSDGAPLANFGWSVAACGDVVLVGAPQATGVVNYAGAAYVYERNLQGNNSWALAAKLIAADGQISDFFGYAVAVDGDAAIVGACFADIPGLFSGAAYVFERSAGKTNQWKQVTKLVPSDTAGGDVFGTSVAVAGDVAIVGADGDDDQCAASGSAYVFERNAGGPNKWGQVQKLWEPVPAASNYFGFTVAAAGDVIIVGAPTSDNDIGGFGAAYAFPMQTEDWNAAKKLTDAPYAWATGCLGKAVAVAGDVIVIGVEGAGSLGDHSGTANVYERNTHGTNAWGRTRILWSAKPVGADDDYFGCAVAVDGDVIVVGAMGDEERGDAAGAAYVFERNATGTNFWGWTKDLLGSDIGAGDLFGFSAAVAGDVIVVGSPYDDDEGTDAGAAYVFERNQGGINNWGQVRKLTDSALLAGDNFGCAVAAAGDVIVVGARGDNATVTNMDTGLAYVFERNAGGTNRWGLVKTLRASDRISSSHFGASVAMAGDLIVVGAPFGSAWSDPIGGAYVFGRDHGGTNNWGQVKKLVSDDAETGDGFGCSVAIAGDVVVVGAEGDEPPSYSMMGSAYLFGRHAGGSNNWGQVKKLTMADAENYDLFGHAVAAAGDVIVVGVPYDDEADEDAGAAYVYEGTLFGPPVITNFRRVAGFFEISYPSQPAWLYMAQSGTNLLTGSWTPPSGFFSPGDVSGSSSAAFGYSTTPLYFRVLRKAP